MNKQDEPISAYKFFKIRTAKEYLHNKIWNGTDLESYEDEMNTALNIAADESEELIKLRDKKMILEANILNFYNRLRNLKELEDIKIPFIKDDIKGEGSISEMYADFFNLSLEYEDKIINTNQFKITSEPKLDINPNDPFKNSSEPFSKY